MHAATITTDDDSVQIVEDSIKQNTSNGHTDEHTNKARPNYRLHPRISLSLLVPHRQQACHESIVDGLFSASF